MHGRTCLLLSLPLALVAMASAQAKKSWILGLLNQPRAAVEKTLGKPTKFEGDKDYLETSYARAGFKGVQAVYEKGKLVLIEIEFTTDPGSWQKALQGVGFDPTGAVVKDSTPIDGVKQTALGKVKALPKGWETTYFPAQKATIGGKESVMNARVSFFLPPPGTAG